MDVACIPQEIGADPSWPVEATRRMNRMYRRQRHIYDGTRRYYLLGRDQLIADLQPDAGASVLEIGCGTGRNLVQAARLYPDARFFGIDVSTEMLTSAIIGHFAARPDQREFASRMATERRSIRRSLFGIPPFDHVMISYSLSMIPDWRRVLRGGGQPPQARRPFAHRRFRQSGALARHSPDAAAALACDVRRHAARRSRARAVGDGRDLRTPI